MMRRRCITMPRSTPSPPAWPADPAQRGVMPVTRTHVRLRPDPRRVVIRPFLPALPGPRTGAPGPGRSSSGSCPCPRLTPRPRWRRRGSSSAIVTPTWTAPWNATTRPWPASSRTPVASIGSSGSSSARTSPTSTPSRPLRYPTRPSCRPRTSPGSRRGAALHREPAGDRRGAPLVDRVPVRDHRLRRATSTSTRRAASRPRASGVTRSTHRTPSASSCAPWACTMRWPASCSTHFPGASRSSSSRPPSRPRRTRRGPGCRARSRSHHPLAGSLRLHHRVRR